VTVDIRARSVWDARYQDGDLDLFGLAEEIAVHHSASDALPADASPAAEHEAMRDLEDTGQERFGTGISYNVVVFPSGRAYRGVSWNRRGTHTGGHNSTVRSICFAGNFEHDLPTPAALATAAALVAEGRGTLWRRTAPVKGHRDWKATACPGKNLYPLLPAIAAGRIPQEDEMSEQAEKDIAEVRKDVNVLLELLGGRVDDVGTKAGLTHGTAHERALIVLRRIEGRQIAQEAIPVDVEVTGVDVAEALLELLPKATAEAVVDTMHARLAK